MQRVWRYIFLLGGLAGTLPATSVLTCGFNGGALGSTGCYTNTFSFSESLDWSDAYGTADTVNNPNAVYNPVLNGPWNATTGNGLTVGATLGPAYNGTQTTIARADNFQMVFAGEEEGWQVAAFAGYENYALYGGMFDAQPDGFAGFPGDHLLYTNHGEGPLQLRFSQGVSGAMFRISTPTSGDVNATVKAYASLNPGLLDTPLMIYTINATNAAGSCGTLINFTNDAPTPCNLAPYIGIQGFNGDIRSLVISTTDSAGLLIDTLYLDENVTDGPEPGTFGLFGCAVTLLGIMVRRKRLAAQRSRF